MSHYQHLQGKTVEYHLHLTDAEGKQVERAGIGTLVVEEVEGEAFLSIAGEEEAVPGGGREAVSYTVTDYRLAVLCPHPEPQRAAFQLIEPPVGEET